MIEIRPGNVWTHLYYDKQGASPLKNNLEASLKVEIPNAKYLWVVKSGQSDGYARLWEDVFNDQGNHCGVQIRTGLLPRLIDMFNQGGVIWRVGLDYRQLPITTLQPTQIKLFDFQYDVVRKAFGNTLGKRFGWFPRGVVEVATGGGKTEIAVAMYEMNAVSTFFLVHRKDLMIQARERFEKYGHAPGIIGDSVFEPKDGINIATLQTLDRIFKDPDPTSHRKLLLAALVEDCQQVFFDECHLFASDEEHGNTFVGVADRFDTPFRWGLTATPFMKTRYDNLLLEGVTGRSIYRITTSELVARGRLTPPRVIMKHVPGKLDMGMEWKKGRSNKAKAAHWREVENDGIKFYEARNMQVVEEINKGPHPILVLVKTVEQATYIQALYEKHAKQGELRFLSGKNSAKERREAVSQLQNGTLKALLTTTIFDEGVDIPELRKVILAGGGKSNVKTIQRVGRALRTADGKAVAIIIDFQDQHHDMLRRHAAARLAIYTEQGFEVIKEKKA